MDRWIDG
jgi:hypothetical protein